MPPRPNHLGLPFSGEALQEIRTRAGLDRKTLAEKLTDHGHSVHRTTISRVETGAHMPSPALLRALTEVLQVSVDDLLTSTDKRSRAVAAQS